MFCSSLRKRPDWTSIPPLLLSEQQPRWQESSLTNHDIAIPLPNANPERPETFRLILLSASELDSADTALESIQRLFHQHGGRHVGVVFLISPNHAGVASFMNLQASLLSKAEIPILPLVNITNLPSTLCAFQRQIVASSRSTTSIPRATPFTSLLPYCSTYPPLPEHARNVVSEIVPNIPALAAAATSVHGQMAIREYLSDAPSPSGGPAVAEDVIAFWEQEFIVD